MNRPRDLLPDGLLALLLVAVGLIGTAPAARFRDVPRVGVWVYALVVLAAVAVALRRRFPLGALAVAGAAAALYLLAGVPPGPIVFSVAVALYTVAAYRDLRTASVASGSVLVALTVCGWIGAGYGLDGGAPAVAWVAAPLAVGVTVRVSREQVRQARRDEARRQADAERLRVAQEVHDVVGHGLAAITMQAEIALHLLAKQSTPGPQTAADRQTAADKQNGTAPPTEQPDGAGVVAVTGTVSPGERLPGGGSPGGLVHAEPAPDEQPWVAQPSAAALANAVAALAAISRTSRESLDELRATLGAVRRGGDPDDRTPVAGLARLDALIDRTRAVGVPVAVRIDGAIGALPAPVDLAAYRVVQESLTNVLRHAGAATAEVRLSTQEDRLTVEVTDDGHGGHAPATVGHGLAGMRERVTALGGVLTAGPRPGGGFTVTATIPVPR